MITGKCLTCQSEFTKTFRDIIQRGGPYCKKCTQNRQKDKTKEKNNPKTIYKKLSENNIFQKNKDGRYYYGEENFQTQKILYMHEKLTEKWEKEYEEKKIELGIINMWHHILSCNQDFFLSIFFAIL